MIFLLLWVSFFVVTLSLEHNSTFQGNVKVFHFVIKHWGDSVNGTVNCGQNMKCEWTFSDHIKVLRQKLEHHVQTSSKSITLSLYNIHSWWEKTRDHRPAFCELRTNFSMAESEESKVRYHHLFDPAFKQFDGYSTTHPNSHLQRVYVDAFLNASLVTESKLKYNHSALVKGASYVASDCHKRDAANANRDQVVQMIRNEGFRVDGLARCMRSPVGPEGITLPNTPNTRYNLDIKREVLSRYMFNLAFENSIEPGYVTEKPFDALLAGSVPVYLGDAAHLKNILPHKKAAIFVADFNGNYTALAEYLTFLTRNSTAYEEHRTSWRVGFSTSKIYADKPLLAKSWPCRVCEWALERSFTGNHHKPKRTCEIDSQPVGENLYSNANKTLARGELNGKAVRGSSKMVYLVENGILRAVPDMETLLTLKLELVKVISIPEEEIRRTIIGPPIPSSSNNSGKS